MAPRTKRAAEDSGEGNERATKAARTAKNGGSPPKFKAKKGQTKAALSTTEFTAKALPLHVNITHTPPSITKEGDVDADGKEEEQTAAEAATNSTSADIGFIGNLTLVPSSFSTGSYGWKGSKRITVELQSGDMNGEGEREKVQVMLSINATVLGSKPTKGGKGKKGKKATEEEDEDEEEEGEKEGDEDP